MPTAADAGAGASAVAAHAAAYARKFGDLPLEDPFAYLKATDADAARFMVGENGGKMVGVLRDGAVAFGGVFSVVDRKPTSRCIERNPWTRATSPVRSVGGLPTASRC
jgi:hypothetical protein